MIKISPKRSVESQMLPEERRGILMDHLRRSGVLRVMEMSDSLGVTAITIRRDINQLADEGLVRKVHGGATLPLEKEGVAMSLADTAGLGVGLVVPNLEYYWPGVVQGAKQAASELGLRLSLRSSADDAAKIRQQIEYLLDEGVRGVIMAPDLTEPATEPTLTWLKQQQVPVILMERRAKFVDDGMLVESVSADHQLGASLAVNHLVRYGHRQLGLVSVISPHTSAIRLGWEEAIDAGGHAMPREPWILDYESSINPGVISEIVRSCQEMGITGLLVHADRTAISIAQRCQDLGIALGEEIAIVAYDDEVADLFGVPLTAVRPPKGAIGYCAVSHMAKRLARPDLPVHQVTLAPTLHVRASTVPNVSTISPAKG